LILYLKNLNIALTIFLLIFISCKASKTYSENVAFIKSNNIDSIVIQLLDQQKTFSITDKLEIESFVDDLNNSPIDGAWKGAIWDKIILYSADSTITYNTNGKVFGLGSSGTFYELNEKYHKYWEN
jgi:hypothetical protein